MNNGTPTHTEWHNTRNRMASAFFFSEFAMKLQPGGTAQEESCPGHVFLWIEAGEGGWMMRIRIRIINSTTGVPRTAI